MYEDIFDAKNASEHLSSFNVCNRYLVVLYYQPYKAFMRVNTALKRDQIDELKARYGIDLDLNCCCVHVYYNVYYDITLVFSCALIVHHVATRLLNVVHWYNFVLK